MDVVWQIQTESPLWFRVIVGACVWSVIGVGLHEAIRWVNRRESPVSSKKEVPPKDTLTEAQLKFLQGIDEFIGEKDEIELRNTFDFSDILKYNLRFARRNLFPASVSRAQSEDIDRFFVGGRGRIDLRYARVTNVNNRAEVEWLPGRIGVINTSVKHNESRHKLLQIYSSAQTPASIAAALKILMM